ncbi:MAG TPA: YaiI/YqxD family protein [Stellaceae bacterium]|nr:YaiI/YqxD family protein [Stellaceae bacterium]
MLAIYIDADACPVRDEVYRVAERLNLSVFVVSNGSRPIRPVHNPNVAMIAVGTGADEADHWIAEHIGTGDICVTADIPLAARCLAKDALALAPNGKIWSRDNIGNALAGREVSRHLRELGQAGGGPAPFSKADRSRFLQALDKLVHAAKPR